MPPPRLAVALVVAIALLVAPSTASAALEVREADWRTGLSAPASAAVDLAGRVYVADTTRHRVQLFDRDGKLLQTWGRNGGDGTAGSAPGEFNAPAAVAVSHTNGVYVADTGNDRIQRLSAGATGFEPWATVEASVELADLAFSDTAAVLAADRANDRILRFSRNAAALDSYGSSGAGPGQLSSPSGIAVAADRSIVVADQGNNRLTRFRADGEPLPAFGGEGSGAGQFRGPVDVAIDSAGDVYVADAGNERIQRLSGTGAPLEALGSAGTGPGQFRGIRGVGLVCGNEIYVVDRLNKRVQRLGDRTAACFPTAPRIPLPTSPPSYVLASGEPGPRPVMIQRSEDDGRLLSAERLATPDASAQRCDGGYQATTAAYDRTTSVAYVIRVCGSTTLVFSSNDEGRTWSTGRTLATTYALNNELHARAAGGRLNLVGKHCGNFDSSCSVEAVEYVAATGEQVSDTTSLGGAPWQATIGVGTPLSIGLDAPSGDLLVRYANTNGEWQLVRRAADGEWHPLGAAQEFALVQTGDGRVAAISRDNCGGAYDSDFYDGPFLAYAREYADGALGPRRLIAAWQDEGICNAGIFTYSSGPKDTATIALVVGGLAPAEHRTGVRPCERLAIFDMLSWCGVGNESTADVQPAKQVIVYNLQTRSRRVQSLPYLWIPQTPAPSETEELPDAAVFSGGDGGAVHLTTRHSTRNSFGVDSPRAYSQALVGFGGEAEREPAVEMTIERVCGTGAEATYRFRMEATDADGDFDPAATWWNDGKAWSRSATAVYSDAAPVAVTGVAFDRAGHGVPVQQRLTPDLSAGGDCSPDDGGGEPGGDGGDGGSGGSGGGGDGGAGAGAGGGGGDVGGDGTSNRGRPLPGTSLTPEDVDGIPGIPDAAATARCVAPGGIEICADVAGAGPGAGWAALSFEREIPLRVAFSVRNTTPHRVAVSAPVVGAVAGGLPCPSLSTTPSGARGDDPITLGPGESVRDAWEFDLWATWKWLVAETACDARADADRVASSTLGALREAAVRDVGTILAGAANPQALKLAEIADARERLSAVATLPSTADGPLGLRVAVTGRLVEAPAETFGVTLRGSAPARLPGVTADAWRGYVQLARIALTVEQIATDLKVAAKALNAASAFVGPFIPGFAGMAVDALLIALDEFIDRVEFAAGWFKDQATEYFHIAAGLGSSSAFAWAAKTADDGAALEAPKRGKLTPAKKHIAYLRAGAETNRLASRASERRDRASQERQRALARAYLQLASATKVSLRLGPGAKLARIMDRTAGARVPARTRRALRDVGQLSRLAGAVSGLRAAGIRTDGAAAAMAEGCANRIGVSKVRITMTATGSAAVRGARLRDVPRRGLVVRARPGEPLVLAAPDRASVLLAAPRRGRRCA